MIKTFKSTDMLELDELCNNFDKENKVWATQTNVVNVNGDIMIVRTLFYGDK